MDGDQLSQFDLSHDPVSMPVPSTDEEDYSFLSKYWSNSEDLAFCVVNVLFCTNELLVEFVEYIKTCRLSDAADEIQRPLPHTQFDRLADCVKRLEFTLVERGDKGEVIQMEMTVLGFAIDISFDEQELRALRTFGVAGASIHQVEGLAEAIRNHVEAADYEEAQGPARAYISISRGFAFPKKPCPDDNQAVLKAMLNGIGKDSQAQWVLF